MNVFRKISHSNLFATEKKRTSVQPPESAQKVDIKHEDCFYLVDYEVRGDQLLLCRIAKDPCWAKYAGSKGQGVRNCMVKEKVEMKHLWVGKEYFFVNMSQVIKDWGSNEEKILDEVDFVADRILVVEHGKRPSKK